MQTVPRWAVLSAAGAPVLLIGGWTVAAGRQPPGYDSMADTISALAGHGATDRAVMTAALAGLGVCHLVTALGLRPAALPGRLILAAGGVATVLVAALPLPVAGTSAPHGVAAAIAFAALAVWPALAGRADRALARRPVARRPVTLRPVTLRPVARRPVTLRPAGSLTAAVVLLGLVGWFGLMLYGGGELVGLSERVAAGAQAVWPLVVVITVRRQSRGGRLRHGGRLE